MVSGLLVVAGAAVCAVFGAQAHLYTRHLTSLWHQSVALGVASGLVLSCSVELLLGIVIPKHRHDVYLYSSPVPIHLVIGAAAALLALVFLSDRRLATVDAMWTQHSKVALPSSRALPSHAEHLTTLALYSAAEGAALAIGMLQPTQAERFFLPLIVAALCILEGFSASVMLFYSGSTPARCSRGALATRLPLVLVGSALYFFMPGWTALSSFVIGAAAVLLAFFALFRLRTLALASFPQSTGFLLVAIGVACFFFLKLIVMFFLIPLLHLGHAPSLDDAASEMGRELDETMPTPSTWVPLFWSFVSGLSTGVGALVVLFIPRVSNRNTSFLLAAAGGVMVTLSVGDVIWNGVQAFGYHFASSLVAAGTLSYFVLERCFNYVAHRFLDERGDSVPMVQQRLLDATIEDVEGGTSFEPVEAPARRHYDEIDDEDEFDDERLALRLSKAEPASSLRSGLLIAFILAIHNFPEGLAVGLASLMNTRKTLLMVLAISLHNIPEGIAVACPIYAASGDRGKAILFATLSGLTEPLGALLSVLVLRPWLTFQRLEAAMLFVAGVMVTVSARELLPKAWRLHARSCVLGFLFGVAAMALGIFLFAEH